MTQAAPEQPYGPGAFCDTCGHFAARHGEDGCLFPGGCKHGKVEGQPCTVMTWQGIEWPRPWLPAPEGLKR